MFDPAATLPDLKVRVPLRPAGARMHRPILTAAAMAGLCGARCRWPAVRRGAYPPIAKAPLRTPDPAGQFWAEIDYLGWTVPPLVTTSPAGTPLAQAGVLGAPGTSVLP
jgi:hypothetical protein